MKPDDAELDALLSAMRDGPVPLSSAAEAESTRQRLLPAVRAAVRATPLRLHRARRRRVLWSSAAACAVAAAVMLAVVQLRGAREPYAGIEPLRVEPLGTEAATWIDAAGARNALPALADVSAPGELVAPESSWSRVSTQRGVRVDLAPRTRLRVTAVASSARSGLRLERGEVRCRVPKLGESEQFSIATPDAQVIVHGTVFSVRFGEPLQPSTCVRVSEGLVEVRHRGGLEFLGPGMEWGCARPAPVSAAAVEASRGDLRDDARRTSARTGSAWGGRRRGGVSRTPDGTLDEENALLAAALAAERAEQPARARALFSTLLAEHPRSPLAPEARRGLLRTR